MNNKDLKRIILIGITSFFVVIVLISLIISQFFTEKQPAPSTTVPITTITPTQKPLPSQFGIEETTPSEDTSIIYFPNQQIGFTFNKSVDADSVIYSVTPNAPVNIKLDINSNRTVVFTPKTTWQKGITTITILPQTKALDGQLLNQSFVYKLNSEFPSNPPADWKGY
ncbi:MAG: hypothetical protein WCV81_00100 [Microgenomates group bacterium]|jgi:hypothetical protein